ncbi:diacylglycerol/polyprenol kinase family protein [Treponema pedis]|uniref:Phosphatidate cytidylyltransferase n=1 Tax=Treponema pedis TaxID=409322 RepID=A0A7S6WPE9_9SPIR|nr:phosphatidate cytidylyltransferase [Treponema pedis]QOW60903.1 phosphatidate cytidylyltransferase [Treponema pedis]
MNFIKKFRYSKFSQSAHTELLLKEVFRKIIHVFSAAVLIFAKFFFIETVIGLSAITVLYIVFEILRLHGKKIILVSAVTRFASRDRDRGKFVLGPVTLSIGIIFTLVLFPYKPAAAGISALALGDGLASVAGKIFGKTHLPFTSDKTIAGTLTCFSAVFISSLFITKDIGISFITACAAAVSEALPLKNLDNILIPLVCAGTVFFLL